MQGRYRWVQAVALAAAIGVFIPAVAAAGGDCTTETHWNAGTPGSISMKSPETPTKRTLTAQYQDQRLLNGMWLTCPFWTGANPVKGNIPDRRCGEQEVKEGKISEADRGLPPDDAGFRMTVEGCQTTSEAGGSFKTRCTLKNGDGAGPKNVKLCLEW